MAKIQSSNLPFLRPQRIKDSLKNMHTGEGTGREGEGWGRDSSKLALLSIPEKKTGRVLRAEAYACPRESFPLQICITKEAGK